MSFRLRHCLPLLLLGLVAGCANSRVYESPSTGPMAEVTFHADTLIEMSQGGRNTVDFTLYPCRASAAGSIRLTHDQKTATVKVRAGEPLRILADFFFGFSSIHSKGSLYLLFVPQEGGKYSADFRDLGGKFTVAVRRVQGADGSMRAVRTLYGEEATARMRSRLCRS
jgi:hypothetical protein